MKTKILNRLSVRLILSISFILVTIFSVYTYIIIKNLDKYLTESRFQSAYNISDLIKKSTRYSMLLNRREDVHQTIKTLGTEVGVKNIRIYNKQGLIIFSTDSSEIFKKVNVTAEACIVCHNSTVPLQSLTKQNKIRIYKNAENKRVLGLINPIQNEPDCSNAACHAHSPKVKILGVLDVVVTLDELDKIIAQNTRNTILSAVLITIAISFFCGLFISVLVNKPMKKLTKGIDEVGKGNLNYQIDVRSKSEFGQMAKRFNEMSEKLNEAYKEIKNWSDTLNDKVNEKTEELKNIYNQVNQIEKLASLGKLSATVAHELNNPLEGILTYSKLIIKKLNAIQRDSEYSKMIEYLSLISDESSRCGKIVKDLLLFSHEEKDVFAKENLSTIIDKSITLIKHHLEIQKISLQKEYPEEEVIINCNAQKIQQALMSLFINSIEAMPHEGKIIVKLSIEKNQAVIRVIDEGTGISEKDLPHIFEPFYSTKEASKGTGLGLAVVYGIIANHNGQIDVENTSLKGTTFKIRLPQTEQIT
ncbi:MAG TPA: HAMP domain-containing sensor histidine kinase [Ignavibacteriaceae bacterium]|nr:HAMP domain-containing sensor histidine kinase [Ignavibacteriaceae bacterium]